MDCSEQDAANKSVEEVSQADLLLLIGSTGEVSRLMDSYLF
jgi:hypothetical protein